MHKRYSEERETIMDDDRCGRPMSKSKASDFKLVKNRLNVDEHIRGVVGKFLACLLSQ